MTEIDISHRLVEASLNGARFYVDSEKVTPESGVITHEFPNRDSHFNEDLGHKATKFSVAAYFAGEDWQSDKDRFFAELRTHGIKQLVLPTCGNFSVRWIGTADFSANREKLGKVEVSLTFVEDDGFTTPFALASAFAQVDLLSRNARNRLTDDFENSYSIENQPGAVRNQAVSLFTSFATTAEALRSSALFTGEGQALERSIRRYARDIEWMAEGGQTTHQLYPGFFYNSQLSENRTSAASRTNDIVRLFRTTAELTDRQKSTTLADLARWTPGAASVSGSGSDQAECNLNAFARTVRSSAIYELCQHIVEREYETRAEARDQRLTLRVLYLQAREEMVTSGAQEALIEELDNLSGLAADHLCSQIERAADVVSVTARANYPAAVAAFKIYGDPNRVQEIVCNNPVSDPFFMPTEFEALNR